MKLSIAAIVLFAVAAFSLSEGPNIKRDNAEFARQIQIAGGQTKPQRPAPTPIQGNLKVTQRTGELAPDKLAMALQTFHRNK